MNKVISIKKSEGLTMNNILNVEHIETVFQSEGKEIVIIDDVSFSVKHGEIVCVVGESGCGKTVTALSIMGLLGKKGRVRKGRIVFDGITLSDLNAEQIREICGNKFGMIFQDPFSALNPVFSVGFQLMEGLKLHLKMNRKKGRAYAIEMLKKVDIAGAESIINEYPHVLSGGMSQRVMIAMALSCNPKLLIADEPTTALDVTVQAQILDLIKELRKDLAMSVLLITHDFGVVAEMADKVLVMYAGQVVEKADVFTLFDNPLHPYTSALMNLIPHINVDSNKRLIPIKGNVPLLLDGIQGCRFKNRCSYVKPLCYEKVPDLMPINDHHSVRCCLYEELAERGLLNGKHNECQSTGGCTDANDR